MALCSFVLYLVAVSHLKYVMISLLLNIGEAASGGIYQSTGHSYTRNNRAGVSLMLYTDQSRFKKLKRTYGIHSTNLVSAISRVTDSKPRTFNCVEGPVRQEVDEFCRVSVVWS